uniref:Uncharacterized protein n=1 Tax=Rhizophora mucronata TaxID=61149 RepID=A0A2P2NAD6_RHIMU
MGTFSFLQFQLARNYLDNFFLSRVGIKLFRFTNES